MCSGEGAIVQPTRDPLPAVVVGLCEGMRSKTYRMVIPKYSATDCRLLWTTLMIYCKQYSCLSLSLSISDTGNQAWKNALYD